ncbi:LuxR family transcriptional regulator [Streptomyces sp. NBC_01022]|uniref:LuxR family transcriptional regulator n=1 Tax=Streptomyces sp. NBC_01022 TaxID=2903723 RepID=UPI002DDA3C14|nr:LuxR family transcriptional regulator [Streptomyces sp. NBC_01022]WRZ82600.1 LuxR family transcriptional regulator [Streptomyces sp. NBC_01022]
MSTTHRIALEQALAELRALTARADGPPDTDGERQLLATPVASSWPALLDTARSLVGEATRSIDMVDARRSSLWESAPCLTGRAKREAHGAASGVSVRLLTIPPQLDDALLRDQWGAAVRGGRMPPLQALVVDGRAALVVTESETGARSSVLRTPEVLNTICSLFESVWADADPAHRTIVFGDAERTALARRILGHLHAGVTDEVAARELTVSVRTYGRYVAEIMTLLGANSRFQMGVRAAELGLIPTPRRAAPIEEEDHARHPAEADRDRDRDRRGGSDSGGVHPAGADPSARRRTA